MRVIKKITLVTIVAALIMTIFPLDALAQVAEDPCKLDENNTCEEDYDRQNIRWYRPKDEACAPSGGSGSSVSSLRGADNREKIYNYLMDAGLTSKQAAGVVGNINIESGRTYSPTIQEFGRGFGNWGYGLVQWTNPENGPNGRRTEVVNFMTERHPDLMAKYYKAEYSTQPGSYSGEAGGYVPKNAVTGESMPVEDNDKLLLAQLDFMYKESTSRPISSSTAGRGFGTVDDNEWETVKAKDDIAWASNVWVFNFEIPGDIEATAAERVIDGEEMYALLNSAGSSGAGTNACGADQVVLSGAAATRAVQIAEAELARWESGEMAPGTQYTQYSFGYETEWCALFVSWIYKEAGFPVSTPLGDHATLVSQLATLGENKTDGKWEWHPNDGTYTPRPGDIATYHELDDPSAYAHTNLVISATSPTDVVTIGGNEGSTGVVSGITSTRVKKSQGDYWPGRAVGYTSPVESGGPDATAVTAN